MNLKDTILALSCIAFTLQSSAQNDADIVTPYRNGSSYIDPAPNGFEPVYIEFEEATSEAQANTKLAGFSEVYFSGAEINEILKDSKAVGIRFYNAYEPVGQHTKSPPHKQHIWFLPTQKPTLKKPKELFFANALTEIE